MVGTWDESDAIGSGISVAIWSGHFIKFKTVLH